MGKRQKYDLTDMRLPDFTKRFRKIVDALGGVTKVSEITKISLPTINFWYNGQRTPDAESLITLSNVCGANSKISAPTLYALAICDIILYASFLVLL